MRCLLIVVGLSFGLVSTAGASEIAYRSDHQAEAYLEHGLKRWAGVDLQSQKYKFRVAFCLPGARSKYEKTHQHFPVRTTKTGKQLFHTFACTLATADRVWHLYLVAFPRGKFGVRTDQ
jgi:hypothetical protein